MSLNIVVLSGRMTNTIEIKSTPSGVLVGSFSIAVNEFFNQKEYTSFINCTAFGKTAERMQKYTSKGSLVAVNGVLRQERWDTKEGEKRSRISVIANRIEILDFKKGSDSDTNQRSAGNDYMEDTAPDFMDDDIPF